MKNILAWIKSNPLIVIFSALILLVLPGSWFGATAWGGSIRKKQEQAAGAELTKVKSAMVDYRLPTFDPASAEVTLKAVPNEKLTEWFKAQKEQLTQASTAAFRKAEDFNRGLGVEAQALGRRPHQVLVEGLFPAAPSKEAESAKLYEMEDRLLGKREHANPYREMLAWARAGEAAEPLALAERLTRLASDERTKITANRRELTSEEHDLLDRMLVEQRLAMCQDHAKTLSVYATIDSLPQGPTGIPREKIEAAKISPEQFFVYQWDLWVLQDVIGAVRLANTSPSGEPVSVDRAVVKRIEKMTLTPLVGFGTDPGSLGMEGAPTPGPDDKPGLVPVDMRTAISGRSAGSWNTVYDLREATITAVVSSSRLPEFVDALERTNFMTVTDMDLAEVDAWEDLRGGFYYGPEHVVKATLKLESVWLRSWTEPLMPEPVKQAVKGAPAEGAMGGEVTPQAPVREPSRGGKGGTRGGK